MSHKILRLREVMARTGLSRSSIYLKIRKEDFPKPISLGLRSIGWIEHDIEGWICRRIEISQNNQAVLVA